MRSSKLTAVAASVLATGLVLASCGSDDEEPGTGGTETEGGDTGAEFDLIGDVDTGSCAPASAAAELPDAEGTGDDETEINIGVFSGWDENYVVADLAKIALEEQGYTVTFTELEAGPAYQGVADGDIDVILDAWLPGTHAQYVDEFGDQLEDVGCWFDEGFLTLAVNADSPAQSAADLTDNADAYGSRIVGIEPGAGLTTATVEQLIPTYGLDDWDYPTVSTAAMLQELDTAMANGDNIAVSLWHPHWAYAAYDIRDLEDPEGTLGEAERLYSLGRPGFHEDFPNAAQLLKNLYVTNDQLLELEDIFVVQNERAPEEEAGSIQTWLDANPDFLDNWRAGTLGG